MSLRPRARCQRRSIQKEAIPRPNIRTKNAIAPTTIKPTRPLRRRWAGGRGISDSGRITPEATRQRERVRIDIQDVRGIYNAGWKTVTQGIRASRGVVFALGARTIVTTGRPFHLDVYDNYR